MFSERNLDNFHNRGQGERSRRHAVFRRASVCCIGFLAGAWSYNDQRQQPVWGVGRLRLSVSGGLEPRSGKCNDLRLFLSTKIMRDSLRNRGESQKLFFFEVNMKKKERNEEFKLTRIIRHFLEGTIAVSLLVTSVAFAGTVSDKDGNKYKTTKIGNLEWMIEDSKFETENSECVDNQANPDNCVRQYWGVINDVNLCPTGWRLPVAKDLIDISQLFLPEGYDQMTVKQKRHAFPAAEQAFRKFFDSINWPETNYRTHENGSYYFNSQTPNYVGKFFRPPDYEKEMQVCNKSNGFGCGLGLVKCPCSYGFFQFDGSGGARKVRCVREISSLKKETPSKKTNEESKLDLPQKHEQDKVKNTEKIIKDPRDGNMYQTIDYKGRIWMSENLKYASKKSVCFDKSSENCEKYGRLYTWLEAIKACPNGWRLPSEKEWEDAPQGIWDVFAGYFYTIKNAFYKKDAVAYYWTISESDSEKAVDMDLDAESKTFVKKNHSKTDVAFSVRCIKE